MTSLNGNQRAASDMTVSLPRRITLGSLVAISFTASLALSASVRAADADDEAAQLGKVVVTARNREESAQDVPIPMSVIGGKNLDRDGTVALEDLVKKSPGLEATTPNSRRTGISIRGIGKSAGNDALEASMGAIVDGVFLTHPGMTYQDFTDLDRVEVLRGPQGTLLGKNTTIGAVNYVSKAPSFSPQASVNLFASSDSWSHDTRSGNASLSDKIVDGVLAYRISVFSDKQDGDIKNVNTEGGTTNEKNRSGQRVQFLYTPTDSLSVKLNLDSSQSNERSNTKPIIRVLSNYDDATQSSRVTAPTGTVSQQNAGKNTYLSIFQRAYFGGYTPIVGSWTQEDLNLNVPLLTTNQGGAATVDWRFGNSSSLTSITAVRSYHFDAKNDNDQTKFDTGRNGSRVDAGQQSQEFRINSSLSDQLDYQAGLFLLHSWNTSAGRSLYGVDAGAYYAKNGDYSVLYNTAAGKQLLQASLNRVYVTTTITPDTRSEAAFGQLNWHATDKATVTVGLRDTYERKSNSSTKQATFIDGSALDSLDTLGATLGATAQEISSAKNVRSSQVGTTYATQTGAPLSGSALSWLVSPTYQLNADTLLFGSVASGQKSGSVQFNSSGVQLNVKPEKVSDAEAGIKSLLLGRKLLLNANLFYTVVKDYQQTTSIYDAATTALRNDGTLYYQSVLGNIPRIKARGVEIDSSLAATRDLSINLGLAYNDAVYADWHTATCPSELNVSSSTTVCDNTGKQIVAAPRFIGTLGVDYRHPVRGGSALHVWVSDVYRTSQNFDNNLSRYGVQAAYSLTDAGIGLVSPSGNFEVDLLTKNAFDKQYTTSINVGSDGSIGYDGIGARRWVGLVIHAKLK